jgi:glyoxylase-like metal-dependent hydrolase (beta-lactamase superfamily II)
VTATAELPWVEPGAFEVADDVWRVPLPLPNDGLRAVNVYVVVTPGGLVCVDGGWAIPESRELFGKALDTIGYHLADVQRFLVTHVHRDHYTQAVAVRREVGSHVGLGLGEKPTLDLLQEGTRHGFTAQIEGLEACGARDLARAIRDWIGDSKPDNGQWESPDEWLGPGPIELGPRTLDAVETPGHTRGHLVFYDVAGGLLFAGDHVLPTITPSIGFEPVLMDNPLGAFLASLRIVRERPDARLLPAHGPVTESVHARVDELLAHHDRRLDQTLAAVVGGAPTAYDAAQVLRWTRREHRLADLDPFNGMLAVFETAAHLDLLVAQGRLGTVTQDGTRTYSPT